MSDIDDRPGPSDPGPEDSGSHDLGHAVDTSVAHPARVYDALLGGKDNYAADRATADAMTAQLPTLPAQVRANRAFLSRVVRHLVTEHGIERFLDIGSGLPTAENVHQIAQRHDPATHVVYVDNDPLVMVHGNARVPATSSSEGSVKLVHADARDPEVLLADPAVTALLAPGRPVALLLLSILMYFDDAEVEHITTTLTRVLPPGSWMVISHPTLEFTPDAAEAAVAAARATGITYRPRSREQVERLFQGLRPDDLGVVPLLSWRPDEGPPADPHSVSYWAGAAYVP